MSFTKIQPQQLQLPTFFSSSGDLLFIDNSTGVDASLSRDLTGDFSITGSLSVNGGTLFYVDDTNFFEDISGSRVLAGSNNSATGNYNTIVAGDSNIVSGNYNVVLNGYNTSFGSGSAWNTIVAGYQSSFSDNVSGAAIIADRKTTINNPTDHSLIINFASGHSFGGGPTEFNTDLRVLAGNTGLFESSLKVLGSSFFDAAVEINATVKINDDVNITGDLNISGDTRIYGNTFTTGAVDINGALAASGSITGSVINTPIVNATGIYTNEINCNNSGFISGSYIATQSWVEDQGYLIAADVNQFEIDETAPNTTEIEWMSGNINASLNNLSGTISSIPITGKIMTQGTDAYLLIEGDYFTGALKFDGYTAYPF